MWGHCFGAPGGPGANFNTEVGKATKEVTFPLGEISRDTQQLKNSSPGVSTKAQQ